MKTSINYKIGGTPPTEIWRSAFDHAYIPSSARNSAGVVASNLDEVYYFKDEIGNLTMPYVGVEHPALTNSKPRYHSQLGGYVFFPNETGVYYQSERSDAVWPKERWTRILLSGFLTYEAFYNAFYTEYLGDKGFDVIRVRNAGDDPNSFVLKDWTPNQVQLIREVYTDDNPDINLINVRLSINGVYVGKVMSTYRSNPNAKGVGAETNNSHWGFKGVYYRQGVMSDALALQVTNELMNEPYPCGVPLTTPYAKNLSIDRDVSGTIVNGTYTYYSPNNISENISLRKITWIYLKAGVTEPQIITEAAGLLSWKPGDYLDGNGNQKYPLSGKGVGLEITCTDMENNVFEIPQKTLKDF